MTAPPETGTFQGADGTPLFYRAWHPAGEPRAAALVVHGLGEHSGRHARLGESLARLGVHCYAPDLRGHGRSQGPRGHAQHFGLLLDDLGRLRARARAAVGAELPLLLFGHSLGGLIAARYLQERTDDAWAGAILSAPFFGLADPPPLAMRLLARVLQRVAPRLSLPNGIDDEHISHDAAEVRAYREDPLVHHRITPRLYAEMMDATRRALEQAASLRVPAMLLLVPLGDRIVDPQATLRFARDLSLPALTVRELPGMYHEPLHEVEAPAVLAELERWVADRIA